MSQLTTAPTSGAPAIPTIPLAKVAPWALFFGLVALLMIFFVSAEQGAVSAFAGTAIHELTHDARHLLGFPCH